MPISNPISKEECARLNQPLPEEERTETIFFDNFDEANIEAILAHLAAEVQKDPKPVFTMLER